MVETALDAWTIADLLGQFLSEGKNVLVTSHTSKRLVCYVTK